MRLTGKTKIAGIMGWPVGHSRSPVLHNHWLERYRIDGAYIPLPVEPTYFAQALRVLPRLGLCGVNVTVPHKEAALAAVDEADATAQRIGAVNTVVVRADGSLEGRNTDGYGFLENLRKTRPDWRATAGPAVVVGAGGAARAVCFALHEAGAPEIRIVNRTTSRAEALAIDLGGEVRVVPWFDREAALDGAALLVNTTTLGMTGTPPLTLALDSLPITAVVNDIVYAPPVTELLQTATARGNPTVGGLGMLMHQARPGFHAWFGVDPEITRETYDLIAGCEG
jgi:shikimate dehydrogenase